MLDQIRTQEDVHTGKLMVRFLEKIKPDGSVCDVEFLRPIRKTASGLLCQSSRQFSAKLVRWEDVLPDEQQQVQAFTVTLPDGLYPLIKDNLKNRPAHRNIRNLFGYCT